MALLMIIMENYKTIATMKKMFRNLMLVAVAAMAFVACQNDTDGVNVTPEQNTITMTFVADAPESRTSVAIDGKTATYSWSVDENGKLVDRVVFLQTQNANNSVNYKYNTIDTSSVSEGVATFVTEFEEVDDATIYNYAAIFPAQNVSASALTNVDVKLPETQALTEGNYDPSADLMMSKLIKGIEAGNGHGGKLQFSRLAAIGRMNLKGVNAGETIQKVVVTFVDEVVNGKVTLNFEDETATYAETGNNTITLKDGELTALTEGTHIFFTCFPGEYSGAYSVEVTTDKATYSTDANKSIAENNALSFTAGDVTCFNLTVGNRVKGDTKTYTKITNANLADYSGTYLLVYEAGSVAFDGSLTTLDATNNNRAVEINNGTITGPYSASTFTIAKVEGGYSIQSASGKYIGRSATSNGLSSADSYSVDYLNTIENLVIKGKGGNALQYNATSGQERFRYFKTTQKAIALYRQNGTGSDEEIREVQLATPTNLAAVVEGNVVTVTWTAVANATNYDVTVGDKTTNVTTNSATLTLDYEKKYTIEVVAKGGVGYTDSEAASVEVTTGEKPIVDGADPVTITLDCTKQPFTTNLPAGSSNASKTTTTYTDKSGYNWTIASTGGYYFNSSYLMCKPTSYITMPVVEGQKLTSISLYCNSGASTSVKYTIVNADNDTVVGSEKTGVADKTTDLTWELTNTIESTAYRIKISNKNGQITKIVLNYE